MKGIENVPFKKVMLRLHTCLYYASQKSRRITGIQNTLDVFCLMKDSTLDFRTEWSIMQFRVQS